MPRKIILTIFFTALLVMAGAGCASPATAPKPTSANTTPAVIKKPPAENKNPIYDFCEKNKNEIIIRFDAESQSSKAYCRFPDTTECPAAEYFTGKCGPDKGNKIYVVDTSAVKASETCIQNYEPVCGEDKITYTNECVAKMQNLNILHTGACTIVSAPETVKESSANNLNISPAGHPDWLSTAAGFILSQPQSNPRARLDRCSYGGQTVYLLSTSCTDCVDVLYDTNGKALCYPRNDFSGDCPGFSTAASACSRVWTDTR